MVSNLIWDAWLPIKRKSGAKALIAPWQLTEADDPVVALNAPRPDFNGALVQFLIGLLQTTATPKNHNDWAAWLEEPPTPAVLKAHFEPYAEAFALQGEKGSFMQDFELLDDAGFNSIAELLIDSPGGNTVKENKDHFIKRGRVEQVCPCCAAMALFSLQTNAPSGGQGHRTSLRGGGPLTTLVVVDESRDLPNGLWRNVWLNVLIKQTLNTLTGDKDKTELAAIFPWMAKTRTSEKNTGKETTPLDVHPLQMYWGMPRRIRVQWQSALSGHCDLCNAASDALVTQYQTKNYGVNYVGTWQHPLSPYSMSKSGDLLPQHPQPGGMTYQHWLGLFEGHESQFSAVVVKRYRQLANDWDEQLRLYTFGYDMDNMKARCWYETTFPLFTIPETIRGDFIRRVQALTDSSSEFASFVRSCVKEAWFKRPSDAKGDVSFLTQSFYQHTEIAFYQAAKALQTKLVDGTDQTVLHSWHDTLRNAAFDLFDYWAARGDIAQANPRRVADARSKLIALCHSKKIKEILQLPITEKNSSKTSKPKKEAA